MPDCTNQYTSALRPYSPVYLPISALRTLKVNKDMTEKHGTFVKCSYFKHLDLELQKGNIYQKAIMRWKRAYIGSSQNCSLHCKDSQIKKGTICRKCKKFMCHYREHEKCATKNSGSDAAVFQLIFYIFLYISVFIFYFNQIDKSSVCQYVFLNFTSAKTTTIYDIPCVSKVCP
jgi:hypothetical protein